MLEEHKGGEKFFDNLDKNVQQELIIEKLLLSIPIEDEIIIVSGKFGNYLILVSGGLRVGNKIDLSYIKNYIENKNFIFIDDSFYSGRTRDVIKNELIKYKSNLIKTYVIYDGGKIRDSNVCSLYRYYDKIY